MTLAILPVKEISHRVPNKNFRPVGSFSHGIFEIKIKQLLETSFVDEIMITSDSENILNLAGDICNNYYTNKIIHYHLRPAEYSGDCPNDKWIAYLSTQIDYINTKDVMICFATSPFFDTQQMEKFYDFYINSNYDSVAVASKLQTYIWRDGKPFNYDKGWPITQNLKPVHVISSSAFICDKEAFVKTQDRLNGSVGFFESTWLNSAVNIDYPTDFKLFLELWDYYTKTKR